MIDYENIALAVVGGGPAGLAAACAAAEAGLDAGRILLMERDGALGGILNQCVHAGFGLKYFGEELTGPEYAGRFIDRLKKDGIPYLTDADVLSLDADRTLRFVSPSSGLRVLRPQAVVLAMGCRERTRGALNIPGTRPAGIYTAGSAQRLINIEGGMPGRHVVILGSGDIGLIMARRLTLEGAQVERVLEVMPHPGGLARNIAQCLDDFGIPLSLSTTVTEIHGRERLSSVVTARVDEKRVPISGTEEEIACDTLLLSVGLIPENELSIAAGLNLDRLSGGCAVDQDCATELRGVFACGNALTVHDLVDDVTEEAVRAGKAAAALCLGQSVEMAPAVAVNAGEGVRSVVPQRITPREGSVTLSFRVASSMRGVVLRARAGELTLRQLRRAAVTPGETEHITVENINPDFKEITVEAIPDGRERDA